MEFRIKSIILWPKEESKTIRKIDFELDKVNIITGGSEKGKSTIISIIDYCLGSSYCKIPTRTIRYHTQWFGILISLKDGDEMLLARQEPGMDKMSGDMYIKIGKKIIIPKKVNTNCNYDDVKHRLNDLAELPYIDFEKNDINSGFQTRPSFRDMVSFVFQPQYIVANQSSLYYKSDSSKHREKLKTIFPYVLKAVDNEYLELKEELRNKERELLILQKELEKRIKISEKWLGEIRANYNRAKEYGLLNNAPPFDEYWKPEEYISYLRGISNNIPNDGIPLIPIGATTQTTERISVLQEQEIQVAFDIQNLRNRQELIKKIDSSNQEYRKSLLSEHSRLSSVNWFNDKLENTTVCPFCNSETSNVKEYVQNLIQVNNEILEKGYKNNDQHTVLNEELKRLINELNDKEKGINIIRDELKRLQKSDNDGDKRIQTINSIYKFIGQLETELKNYDAQLDNSDLIDSINLNSDRIEEINEKIKQDIVNNKIQNAKIKITNILKFYAKIFNAANYDERIELNIKDLTLNFIPETGRYEALYEIGSASNYMAYHLSTMLALHEFFLKQKSHPVPNFIIFDQPSQAYFPDTDKEKVSDKDEDVDRVKKIFKALESAIIRTKGNLQVIVLEHVGDYAWKDYENMHLVKRWREDEEDNALIPRDWLT
ncbi:MAG: DUF3732 domain-containing protein [Chitinophagales bacterium]|nr:DUF3732 domain-containing protein [Chitinophagales bacterium]